MKPLLIYFLQMTVVSGILYGYYHFFLRNSRFHLYNRYYLLIAAAISFVIPFLRIPFYFTDKEVQSSIVLNTLKTIYSTGSEKESVVRAIPDTRSFDWSILLYSVYAVIAFILLIRIIMSVKKVFRIINSHPAEELDGIHFINTEEPGTPFSFFRWLFWNRTIALSSAKGQQIFRHEVFHIQQRHSWDVMIMEIVCMAFWINPAFHLIRKEIRIIHEFLADQFAVKKEDKWEYAELLLLQALPSGNTISSPFFHNQIKRRIAMITNSQKTSYRYLRKLLVLPLGVLIVILLSFSLRHKPDHTLGTIDDTLTIVIDAGHGGTDPGVESADGNITESQLTLELAKVIQKVAGDYNVNVILTRENANFPGNTVDKISALKKRIEIAERAKPMAFISLHVKTSGPGSSTAGSGFEALVSAHDGDEKSTSLATAILQNLSPVYQTETVIKKRKDAGVYVLDKNLCPAVLLECGYIDNIDDITFLTNKSDQEKIARSILQGILNYRSTILKEATTIKSTFPDTVPPPATKMLKEVKKDNSKKVFEKVDSEPSFQGGETKWKKYLSMHLDQSVPVKNNAPDGEYTVYIIFTVLSDGSIEDLRPLTNHGFGMEEEAMRILRLGPKWVPAVQKGRNVNAYKRQRFDFIIKKANSNTTNSAANPVDREAIYEEGQAAWRRFLERSIDPNTPIKNGSPAGDYHVLVQFLVKKDGSLGEIKSWSRSGYGMETEAERAVKESKGWLPAIRNGKPVSSFKTVSINFLVIDPDLVGKSENSQQAVGDVVMVGYKEKGNKKAKSKLEPSITVAELKKADMNKILNLEEGIELVSYRLSIDREREILTVTNEGNNVGDAAKNLLNEARAGRLITIEEIKIKKEGREVKIPSRFFYVVD